MVTRAEIVKEAREWIGTPYIASQRKKGVACDCVGLFWGITDELGLDVSTDLLLQPNYARYATGDKLIVTLRKYMDEIHKSQMIPGDLLVLKVSGVPTHVGILADFHGKPSIIHADNRHGVIETRLGFWSSKIVTVFTVRELED